MAMLSRLGSRPPHGPDPVVSQLRSSPVALLRWLLVPQAGVVLVPLVCRARVTVHVRRRVGPLQSESQSLQTGTKLTVGLPQAS